MLNRIKSFFQFNIKGEFLILMGGVLWGTTGTAQALGPENSNPFVVGCSRLVLGGLSFLLIAWMKDLLHRGPWPYAKILLSSLAIITYQFSFFYGVSLTGVAIGTVVALGAGPITAGVIAHVMKIEKIRLIWIIATAIALAGCWLLVGSGGDAVLDPLGVLLCFISGMAYATFATVNKSIIESMKLPSAEGLLAIIFCLGGLVGLPVILLSDLSWMFTGRGMSMILYLGTFATAGAYGLFTNGQRSVPSSTAVVLSAVEPLTAAVLAILLLNEHITAPGFAGMAMIIFALFILASQDHDDQGATKKRRFKKLLSTIRTV